MKIRNGEKRNVARRKTRIKLMTTIGDVCIKGEESGDKRRGRLILRDAMEIRVDTSNPLCTGYTRTRIIPRLHEALVFVPLILSTSSVVHFHLTASSSGALTRKSGNRNRTDSPTASRRRD